MTQIAHVGTTVPNKFPAKCSDDFSWRDFLCSLFPQNTAAYVASLSLTSVRAAEHVLAGRNSVSGKALINLLRSPVGPKVLDAIAADAEWRAIERRLLAIHELEQELQNLEHKKRALERALGGPR